MLSPSQHSVCSKATQRKSYKFLICCSVSPVVAFVPVVWGRSSHVPNVHRPGQRDSTSSQTHRTRAFACALLVVPFTSLTVRHRRRPGTKVKRRATPYPDGRYDPEAAAQYFQERPLSVLARATELLTSSFGFALKLVLDSQRGASKQNENQRAQELTTLITRLGPTFIKIGQALSIRADLLSPAYLKALTELQDRVPPVPTKEADEILERELGKPIGEVFEEITPEPIASASLGQVYRARLRDGPEVAVKVQRPGMQEVIALDLHLLRLGAEPIKRILALTSPLNTDIVGLIDAWGLGFVGELNYLQEAANAEQFESAIAKTPLAGVVCVPPVVHECTTTKVLTTEWIIGERLEQSTASDVTYLCSVAMNSYLTMLLELGVLHADPHPGNLLRKPDGTLCILDWGLVTEMDEGLQMTFIEHVAHLVSRDYEPVPSDLVKLGFVPEGMESDIQQSDVVSVLADIYGRWADGGGAAGVDVNRFLNELNGLSSQYGNLFRVPPYFFYIARAFAVLEGIGLTNNSTYSIVQECLPYISQRLLNDRSPRAAGALASFVYGRDKSQSGRLVDAGKIEYLADGFSSYSTSSGGLQDYTSTAKQISRLTEQLTEIVLGGTTGGEPSAPSPIQQIVIDELAKTLGASARQAFSSVGIFPKSGDSSAESPVWRVLTPDDNDKRTLENVDRIAEIARPRVEQLLDSFRLLPADDQLRVANEVVSKLWASRAGAVAVGGRLIAKLASQSIMRVRENLLDPLEK